MIIKEANQNENSALIGSSLGIERLGEEQDSCERKIKDITDSNNELLTKIDASRSEVAFWEAECNRSKS